MCFVDPGEREGRLQCILYPGVCPDAGMEPWHGDHPDHPQSGPLMAVPTDKMVDDHGAQGIQSEAHQ